MHRGAAYGLEAGFVERLITWDDDARFVKVPFHEANAGRRLLTVELISETIESKQGEVKKPLPPDGFALWHHHEDGYQQMKHSNTTLQTDMDSNQEIMEVGMKLRLKGGGVRKKEKDACLLVNKAQGAENHGPVCGNMITMLKHVLNKTNDQ